MLKSASEARGAFYGRRAWMNILSRSVRNFAVSGTVSWSVSGAAWFELHDDQD